MIGAREIDYFRKKYVRQAVVAFLMLGAGAYFLSREIEIFFGKAFVFFAAGVIFYRMFNALREELQVRGEGVILSKGRTAMMEGACFSVGGGVDENEILALQSCPKYRSRECLNIIKGEGFCLEEEWLYEVISRKPVVLHQTAFEGVVLVADCLAARPGSQGKVRIFNGKMVFGGEMEKILAPAGGGFLKLFKVFGVNNAVAETGEGKVYVWIGGGKKIFYQFGLLKENSVSAFVLRTEALVGALKEIAAALK